MAVDMSLGIFDEKTQRLGFDEREVSLSDIVTIAKNHFKNVDVNRIIIQDHNNWHRPDKFHVYLSVRKPSDPSDFVIHQSGERSCKTPQYQTLGQLLEQAEAMPNCDLGKVRLVSCADNDQISLYFAADCQMPWTTTRFDAPRKPLFQPLMPAHLRPPDGGYSE